MVTRLLAIAVPVTVGVVLLVMPSLWLLPVSVPEVKPLTLGGSNCTAIARLAVALVLVPSLTLKPMVRVAVLGEPAVSL